MDQVNDKKKRELYINKRNDKNPRMRSASLEIFNTFDDDNNMSDGDDDDNGLNIITSCQYNHNRKLSFPISKKDSKANKYKKPNTNLSSLFENKIDDKPQINRLDSFDTPIYSLSPKSRNKKSPMKRNELNFNYDNILVLNNNDDEDSFELPPQIDSESTQNKSFEFNINPHNSLEQPIIIKEKKRRNKLSKDNSEDSIKPRPSSDSFVEKHSFREKPRVSLINEKPRSRTSSGIGEIVQKKKTNKDYFKLAKHYKNFVHYKNWENENLCFLCKNHISEHNILCDNCINSHNYRTGDNDLYPCGEKIDVILMKRENARDFYHEWLFEGGRKSRLSKKFHSSFQEAKVKIVSNDNENKDHKIKSKYKKKKGDLCIVS